jgi:hypothetical protein
MFLGSYHFDGDPADLRAGYERLMGGIPPESTQLHVCVERDGGITVFDACPSRDVFLEFSGGAAFRSACAAAGLPPARVELLGEVVAARLGDAVAG